MTALLTSDGIAQELQETFISLLSKSPTEYKVAFITTAALDRGDDNPSWLEHYRKEIREFGITAIEDIDLRKYDKQTLQKKLKDKDIIYVNGGNTYFLMKYVNESGFGALLPQLLEEGKLYVGVSAGSVIMGVDIGLASWIPNDEDVNDGYVVDTKGVNIIPFAIWPHFQTNHTSAIEKNVARIDYSVIALTNEQAALWQNNTYKIIGKGNELVYKPPANKA
jgi:dipeptidase E